MFVSTIVGNLGRDPEGRKAGTREVVEFSVGVKVGKDQTNWVKCTVWSDSLQGFAMGLRKGDKVTCVGRLQVREFSKKDGGKGYSIDLSVDQLSGPSKQQGQRQADYSVTHDDIPGLPKGPDGEDIF